MEATVVNRTIIRYVNAFSSLSDAECDALLACVKERRLAAHEVLFRQDDRGDSMAIVHHGVLSVRVRRPDGHDAEVARVGEGEVLGELSLVDPAPRSATVVAEAPAMVCELPAAALVRLREGAPGVYATVMAAVIRDITRRAREVDARVAGLLAPPGSKPPAGVGASQAPPRAMASQAPPRAGASQAPPRAGASQKPPAEQGSGGLRGFLDRLRGLS